MVALHLQMEYKSSAYLHVLSKNNLGKNTAIAQTVTSNCMYRSSNHSNVAVQSFSADSCTAFASIQFLLKQL